MADEDEQTECLIQAITAQDDFDFAYRLQLQEAMAASCSNTHHLIDGAHAEKGAQSPSDSNSGDDRAMAFALQNEELYRSQSEENDRRLMIYNTQQIQLEVKRRAHDAVFAKSLMDMDDREWEAHGDLIERPLDTPSDRRSPISSEFAYFCKLYFTVASSENNTIFAMGAVISDTQNIVLAELKKLFPTGTNKATADYMALLSGLQTVHAMGFEHIEAHTDSLLLYNQVTNRWRVRSNKMQALWLQVREYVQQLTAFHMFLEPRNLNQHAMWLAREAASSGVRTKGASGSMVSKQTCSICLELKHQAEMIKISGCLHDFCNACIIQHSEVNVQSGKVPVGCPQVGCTSVLSLDQCRSLLSQRWYELLNKRLVEASIPEAERVYCPYSHCSALMDKRVLNTNLGTVSSSTSLACKMCVECARFFCAECRIPWHVLMTCDEYQKIPPEFREKQDAELHQLAQKQKWQRCKKCRRMIELSEGCYHMTCRCGFEFCYLCGKEWKGKAATCKCRLWDEENILQQPAPIVNDVVHNGLPDDTDTDSYDDDDECDEVNGRSDLFFGNNQNNPYYKTRLCMHWASGMCFAGLQCNFAHGHHELR